MKPASVAGKVFVMALIAGTISAARSEAQALYGVTSNAPGNFYRISPTTGVETLIGTISNFKNISGIAFEPTTEILYAVGLDNANEHVLLTIDLATGAGTKVGPTNINSVTCVDRRLAPGPDNEISDISFRSDGMLYAYLEPDDCLGTIDKSTGAFTLLGSIGHLDLGNGIAFSSADVLYHAGYFVLDTLDQASGAATLVTSLGFPSTCSGGGTSARVRAMDFRPGMGTLFGVLRCIDKSRLGTIDTSTGVITDIGQTVDRLDAIAFGPSVELIGLEVNQAVQDWRNSLPLIKDKKTYVRAHIQTTDPAVAAVNAVIQLRGFRDGIQFPDSPLRPLNVGGTFQAKPDAAARRSTFNDSVNFLVPEAWLQGTVKFRVERTDGGLACEEPADANGPPGPSDCQVTVTFIPAKIPSIKFFGIDYVSPNGTPLNFSRAALLKIAGLVTAMYPVSKVDADDRVVRPWSGTVPPDVKDVTADLVNVRANEAQARAAAGKPNQIYYGAIPSLQSTISGVAAGILSSAASGYTSRTFSGFGRATPAHEIGHTLGRAHSVPPGLPPQTCGRNSPVRGYCGECAKDPPQSGYFPNFFEATTPSPEAEGGTKIQPHLGPMPPPGDDSILVFGLDTSSPSPSVIDPKEYFDVMSYCGVEPLDMWISDHTYEGLSASINATFEPSPRVLSQAVSTPQDYLIVRGKVNFDYEAVQLLPMYTITTSSPPPFEPSGSYRLRVLDGGGGLIQEISFEPQRFEGRGKDLNVGMFLIPVPANPSIRRVVVLHDEVVLASRSASIQPPSVQVIFPNGGETVTQDPVLLQWSGNDADGDVLTYDVQYSYDGGATWRILVSDWPGQTVSIQNESLRATTNGLIRVTAKDGFWTATDQSDAFFTVPNHAPSVSILSPTPGQSFSGSQQVVLEASASDTEDGRLSGTSLQWSSNIDGALGSGQTLLKQANQLSQGNHTITATATDSGSLASSASMNITIGAAAPVTFADLSVAQAISPNPPAAGAPMILTITVTNSGRDGATAVTLSDTLPAGVSFGSAGSSQGNCVEASGTVTCTLGALAASGATATVTITITPLGPGPLTNSVSASANEFDPVPVDNSSTETTTALPSLPNVSNPAAEQICAGTSAVFSVTASGSPPLAYRWRRNGFELSDSGSVSGSATATLTINPAAATDSGAYDVRVTDGFGQLATSAVAALTVTPLPSAAIATSGTVCASRAGNRASVPSAGVGATYAWTITNGTITGGVGSSAITFASGAGGSVMLNVTVGNTCGMQSGGVSVGIAGCSAEPRSLQVDAAPDGGLSNGNGILEAGETVVVRPFWKNPGGSPLLLSGTASSFTGPAGATYTLNDSSANYGSIAAGATNDCGTATGNCYEVSVSNPPTRPATHWDALLTETLSDGDPPSVWPLHIGQSFTDVPKTHTFYSFVERILHNGVTTGCTGTTYCPDATVFRLQMGVFIARAQAGGDANIPVSGSAQGNPYNCVGGGQSQFTDIDPTNPFCRHVHYLFATGVTTGCVTTPPRQYCPGDNVSRGQMALFIGRAVAGSDAAVPLTYGPDPVTGRSYSCSAGTPNLHFTDIATSDIYCRHTHYLWAKDVISGFPDGSFGPGLPVTRGAMAKFLANGFNLFLYKP